jgi:hypothetical protein
VSAGPSLASSHGILHIAGSCHAGELKLVASGFVNPSGVHFVGHHLWVTDINGDFIAGKRELPDDFLVQIGSK